MEFDFTSILDRAGHDAIAVEAIPIPGAQIKEGFSRLPMWVADMNFATAPSVIEAVRDRLNYPTFGYYAPSKEYFDSIISWQKRRNGIDVPKEAIGYENGVLGGVISAAQAFTVPGEAVLLHSPAYIGFIGVLRGNGRRLVYSPLKRDENGIWRMDYEDMDKKIKDNNIRFCVFCSPHNPCGRVWEKWEIEKAMEVYEKNGCIVVSDEIWSDIILGDNKHIPAQSVSDFAKKNTIALYAPSKTFNLAGLIGSYHVIYDDYLRDRVRKQAALSHYNSMNVLSMHALVGAYSDVGERWVDELRQVLTKNVYYIADFITERVKGVSVMKPQGTYMLYLDCSEWLKEHGITLDELLKRGVEVGVIWQDGRAFEMDDTIRLNAALPYSQVVEAMDRLEKYAFI